MPSALGEFLQAARDRVRPADVGLSEGERRRVPGLRREEVAMLAGVSVDYYMRLEQGRETAPSGAVAAGVGRALRLDEHGLGHLYRLAGLTPPRAGATDERVEDDLLGLLGDWRAHPAFVLGQAFDVLAANPLAEALFLGFPGTRNLLESTFLVPEMRGLYSDWDVVARNTVAGFRILHAAQPADDRIRRVLDRVGADADFRAMWADRLVVGRRLESKTFHHPHGGEIDLRIQTFDVRAAPGQELVVYRAVTDASRAGLALLNDRNG
ncbi:helix-turn-helix domain-containing protein [Amnibacterium setariae]|uniref:helix-turn-helix domain-containing protein n=1 Tax=Amnibacterium setariae TaxID=2306585 RepID=UPI001F338B41|nr:helix-turn-helix transcriptional regulator [Amnibacterium setariae]